MIVKGVEGGRPDNYDSPCVPSKERTEDDIVRAQGLGKVSQSREANRPRPTIVRFKVWQDKMLVLVSPPERFSGKMRSLSTTTLRNVNEKSLTTSELKANTDSTEETN